MASSFKQAVIQVKRKRNKKQISLLKLNTKRTKEYLNSIKQPKIINDLIRQRIIHRIKEGYYSQLYSDVTKPNSRLKLRK